MKRTCLVVLVVALVLLAQVNWFFRASIFASSGAAQNVQGLATTGTWSQHNYDLIYTVAFSSQQQPYGPLVVYRAPAANLQQAMPVMAIARKPQPVTPLLFPSPDGRYLALLTPSRDGYNTSLNGASLSILSTDGQVSSLLVPGGVAYGDEVIWSPDSRALYYHTGRQQLSYGSAMTKAISMGAQALTHTIQPARYNIPLTGYDEIHRVDLSGHDSTIFRQRQDDSSLRLVGVDRSGKLILALARPQQPVALLRLDAGTAQQAATFVATLPPDILPGNVLAMGNDGESVVCERVLSWQPLRYTLIRISLAGGAATNIPPLFDASRFGPATTALNRSHDGRVLVMSQVMSIRQDLAAQGIAGVPAQEALLLADTGSGATERLVLPYGGQIVQAFWAAPVPLAHIHRVSGTIQANFFGYPIHPIGRRLNASVFQQDEWMLEGHAGHLADSPSLPTMCYGTCPDGPVGAPHVSAAILHGVAYVESNWHQFNTSDYDVNGEPLGSPVESFDGGWGEYQQTWGMPPQCKVSNNCRSDASRIQEDQSYNIGTGVQSLISAWNGTAGVVSSSDPNDPYKANDWFFAVWAYNGAYGNNPNDVPSSVYGHWYPGAPFRSIYEEYVWYFAAHPQYLANGWTDNYLPSLGSSLLPPQSDFTNTSDSFVYCVTCTIPDWTAGTFDRNWVGAGATDATIAGYFTATFNQNGGEDVVGLPRDNGGGAAVHNWGAGLVQDFGGGSALQGMIMLANGATTAYWVYGGVWTRYMLVDHGVNGCHGYPTSALLPYSDPGLGSDSYYRQAFQSGYIIWDGTVHQVAQDVCA